MKLVSFLRIVWFTAGVGKLFLLDHIVNILGFVVPVASTQLCHCSRKPAIHLNELVWLVTLKFYLWTVAFQFHVIFTCHEIFFFFNH